MHVSKSTGLSKNVFSVCDKRILENEIRKTIK
jgi:hypothetical protein